MGWPRITLRSIRAPRLRPSRAHRRNPMTKRRVARLTFAFAAVALIALTLPAGAQGVADFYRGRNLTLVIGFSAGGGYDLYARLLARHLGRHIPGQPGIVAQNREGAGSEPAILYLYNSPPEDRPVL